MFSNVDMFPFHQHIFPLSLAEWNIAKVSSRFLVDEHFTIEIKFLEYQMVIILYLTL